MFIDVENLRYSLLNTYGQEPDIDAIVEKAKKYGRPSVMRAYADFSEHPPTLTRQLQVAGIEAINVPVKRTTRDIEGKQVERVKNAADMVLAVDALIEAFDADSDGKCKVFLLVTGDRDYVRLVTQLRNRCGQRVIVAGVPGSVAADLVRAAGEEDPVEVPAVEAVDSVTLKKAIVAMVRKGPSPLSYWTLRLIDQWCQDGRQSIPGTAKAKREAIGELKAEGVLISREIEVPNRGRVTETVLSEEEAKSRGYLK
jgi:uncharacterized LabA/DUF88 family protein